MIRTLILAMLVCLVGCTNRENKLLEELKPVDKYIAENNIQLKNIHDSFSLRLHAFATTYPANPKSQDYLYTATLLSEKSGRKFETAKWCEEYLNLFPTGHYQKDAMMRAAFNFEQCGTLDKAIQYYEMVAQKYPKTYDGSSAAQTAKYLKMGLTTPEAQFEYIQKHKDSGTQ
ncbi:MAG: hypothetical protein KG003_10980 [Bacteroidetes bacterium]|nr:hypothetical protein [Bacteroidota bacterium]